MHKKEKVQALSNVIQDLIQQVDIFTQFLTTNDFELLEEAQQILQNKINYKQSAAVLVYAMGGNPDTEEDEYKLKTLNMLIDFMKLRIEYKEQMTKKRQEEKNKKETLETFQNLGLL